MRIVFVASEGVPFSKTGGLADVVGALPKALAKLGHELEVVLPRYRMTKPGEPEGEMQSLTIPLGSGYKFVSIQNAGVASKSTRFWSNAPFSSTARDCTRRWVRIILTIHSVLQRSVWRRWN